MSSELSDKAAARLRDAVYQADPLVQSPSDDEENSERYASVSPSELAQGHASKPRGERTYEQAKAIIERYLDPAYAVRVIMLGEGVTALTDWAEASKLNREAFIRWIKVDAQVVAKRRSSPGFAPIIEAAFRLDLPGVENCIEAILSNEGADPESAAIAGQRVRFARIGDAEQRGRIGRALQVWIERWEGGASQTEEAKSADIDRAVTALPSVPFLLREACLSWMAERVKHGIERIAWASAVGLYRWFSTPAAERCAQASRDDLCKVVLERIAEEPSPSRGPASREDLRAALVTLLGFLASPSTLEPVSNVMSTAFRSPRRFEDAAAVEAGRVLLKRFENAPFPYWHKAFGGAQSKEFFDFNRALAEAHTARV